MPDIRDETNHIVALFDQPDQDTGSVEAARVGEADFGLGAVCCEWGGCHGWIGRGEGRWREKEDGRLLNGVIKGRLPGLIRPRCLESNEKLTYRLVSLATLSWWLGKPNPCEPCLVPDPLKFGTHFTAYSNSRFAKMAEQVIIRRATRGIIEQSRGFCWCLGGSVLEGTEQRTEKIETLDSGRGYWARWKVPDGS